MREPEEYWIQASDELPEDGQWVHAYWCTKDGHVFGGDLVRYTTAPGPVGLSIHCWVPALTQPAR